MTEQITPNHHADYPGFSGLKGLVAALSMLPGRSGDARWAAELARLEAGDTLVDVGCGPGVAARNAARRGAHVVGVDPAPVMLHVARRLTRRSLDVRFVEGAAEALPIDDGAATVLWSIASAHHWSDLWQAFREVRRVLRPSGRIAVIERQSEPGATGLAGHGWTDEQAMAFGDGLRAHGFEAVEIARHDGGRRRLIAVTAIST